MLLLLWQLLPGPQRTKFGRWKDGPICPYKQGEARPGATPSCISARYWAASAVSLFRNYTKMHSTPSGGWGSSYDCKPFRGRGRVWGSLEYSVHPLVLDAALSLPRRWVFSQGEGLQGARWCKGPQGGISESSLRDTETRKH